MIKKNVFIFLVFACITTAANAQQIARDSLRVTINEIAEAQVKKLTHELTLTENQQKQVYSFLLKNTNPTTGIDDAFINELLRILTSQQEHVFFEL